MTDKIRIKIVVGTVELEVFSDPERVEKNLALIKKYESLLKKGFPAETIGLPTDSKEKQHTIDSWDALPVIKGDSVPQKIVSLLSSDWGNSPKTGQEIFSMLKSSGHFHNTAAVTMALVRLTKQGVLRRLKLSDSDTYSYVLAKK